MLKGAFSLTQQAKILSFDEARRARTAHGDHSSHSARSAERGYVARSLHGESARSSSYVARNERASSANRNRAASSYSRASERRESSRRQTRLDDEAYAASRLAYDEEDDQAEESPAAAKSSSRFERFKRNVSKNKADRAFERQYGGADRASGASDAGPRAAVYKGEMGQAHRRASRMQDEKAGSSRADATRIAASRIPQFVKRPWFVATAGAAVCIVLTAAFLYPSAAQLYHSARERDQLQAEYAAIEERNEAIQSTVDALSTDAGIEDRAHQEYGWVSKGENAVTVYGLDVDDESTFTASIVPGSVPAPETWYSKLFGPLFGEE
mgnify:FL=1